MQTVKPTIITDTREQTPLVFKHFPTVTACLSEGDYSIIGHEHRFTIERKSISDLVQSVTAQRERFERELASMIAFEIRYQLPVCFCPTAEAAAVQIERLSWYFCREAAKQAEATATG